MTHVKVAHKLEAWASLGLIAFLGNMLVVFTVICSSAKFRRRYALVAALAAADGFSGLSFFSEAIWEASVDPIVPVYPNISIDHCTIESANPLAVMPYLASQLSALLIFAIAIDRTICIYFPHIYFTIERVDRIHVAVAVLIYAYVTCTIAFVYPAVEHIECDAFNRNGTVTLPIFYTPWFFDYYYSLLLVACGSALAMCVLIVCRLRKSAVSQVTDVRVVGGRRQLQQQTITMFSVVVVNGAFYVVPSTIAFVMTGTTMSALEYHQWTVALEICMLLNDILDVFVYAASNAGFRTAVTNVLCCRACGFRKNTPPPRPPFSVLYAQYNRRGGRSMAAEDAAADLSAQESSTCDIVLNRTHRAELQPVQAPREEKY